MRRFTIQIEEELEKIVTDIADSTVKEQKINTINYYPIDTEDIKDTVIIKKKEDKYKISIDSFEWIIVERSIIEHIEIVTTILFLLKDAGKNSFNLIEQINN